MSAKRDDYSAGFFQFYSTAAPRLFVFSAAILLISVLLPGISLLTTAGGEANTAEAAEIAGAEIMALEEILPGMEGQGRTVFSGMEVEEFDFEVVDVLRDYAPDMDLILVHLSGEKIEESGGVAAGMSGSPLYVDDKIIGAISYGWEGSDNRYALATPIEPMLELIEDESGEPAGEVQEDLPGLAMPLMAGGLSGRALDLVEDDLEDYFYRDFQVIPGGDEPRVEPDEYPDLEPGSSISVQLARGDVNIATIGTLTHVNDGEIIALGHPFTNRGPVDFLLGQAHISSVIPGDMPFKVGSPLPQPIGAVGQDRGAGVSGSLDVYPAVVPLRVEAEDKDRDKTTEMSVQMVDDEELLDTLPVAVTLDAIDAAIDRIGPGTAETELSIMANELEETQLTRENLYYSQSDIAAVSLVEMQQLMEIINQNPYKDAGLFDIEFEVNVSDEDRVALVQEAEIKEEADEIYPGQEIDISVMLRPYRQEKKEMELSVELPEDIDPGPASLSLTGGFSWVDYPAAEEMETEQTLADQVEGYTDLEPMLEDFLAMPKNNELVVEIYPGYPAAPRWEPEEEEDPPEEPEIDERPEPEDPEEEEEPDDPEDIPPEEPEERIEERFPTDYVLEGSLNIDFTVREDREEEENEDEEEESKGENAAEAGVYGGRDDENRALKHPEEDYKAGLVGAFR